MIQTGVLRALSLLVVPCLLTACADVTDLQGNSVPYYDAAADRFCQETEGLQFGTEAYVACRKYVGDYARTKVILGGL